MVSTMISCWQGDPGERPDAAEITSQMRDASFWMLRHVVSKNIPEVVAVHQDSNNVCQITSMIITCYSCGVLQSPGAVLCVSSRSFCGWLCLWVIFVYACFQIKSGDDNIFKMASVLKTVNYSGYFMKNNNSIQFRMNIFPKFHLWNIPSHGKILFV